MKFSYSYDDLLSELMNDLNEGLISMNDTIKVVRGSKVGGIYSPIIDYYYDDNTPREEYEELTVSKVIEEMNHYNKI